MHRLTLVALCAAVIGFSGLVPPAQAQNRDTRELINRIDRLQRELTTLQRYIYRNPPAKGKGKGRPPPPMDGAMPSKVAANLEVRMTRLETEIRTLTGQNEEVSHAIRQLSNRLGKLVSDVDMRLSALEQAQARQQAAAQNQNRAKPKGGGGKPAQGTLGYVPKGSAERVSALPKGTPQQQYTYATSLMKKQDFAAAERALRAFIAANPKHQLTSNAHYWLGESYYVRKDYKRAAFAFASAFEKFPRAPKAPDNLLKLGMSLGQLGRRKEACIAFSRLLDNFPKTRKDVKARVNRQQRRLKCDAQSAS